MFASISGRSAEELEALLFLAAAACFVVSVIAYVNHRKARTWEYYYGLRANRITDLEAREAGEKAAHKKTRGELIEARTQISNSAELKYQLAKLNAEHIEMSDRYHNLRHDLRDLLEDSLARLNEGRPVLINYNPTNEEN